MIIVNQDKDSIVNFDKVHNLWIDDNHKFYETEENDDYNYEILADDETLGYYKTEARAKEILQEIIKKYSSYLELKGGRAITPEGMNVQPNIFNIPKVYEMPKE